MVKLGWGGGKTLGLLISALSSSASCTPNLVYTDSIAVMYSGLGGCLGETAKLGPLASTDLWAWVRGLLDKLIPHFRLGFSSVLPLEEPQGVLALALTACLLALGGAAPSPWELVLTACGEMLIAWELVLSASGGTLCIFLGDSADYLRRCANCLGINIICLGTTCLNSAISLGDSAGYLRRGADCLGVSILCLGTTCLWWDSAISLGDSTDWPEERCWLPGNQHSLPGNYLPGGTELVLVLSAWGLALLVNQVIFPF